MGRGAHHTPLGSEGRKKCCCTPSPRTPLSSSCSSQHGAAPRVPGPEHRLVRRTTLKGSSAPEPGSYRQQLGCQPWVGSRRAAPACSFVSTVPPPLATATGPQPAVCTAAWGEPAALPPPLQRVQPQPRPEPAAQAAGSTPSAQQEQEHWTDPQLLPPAPLQQPADCGSSGAHEPQSFLHGEGPRRCSHSRIPRCGFGLARLGTRWEAAACFTSERRGLSNPLL